MDFFSANPTQALSTLSVPSHPQRETLVDSISPFLHFPACYQRETFDPPEVAHLQSLPLVNDQAD
jgi:hypothetical protein